MVWSRGGGINPEILVDILATIDTLGVFAEGRKAGAIPFFLVDGHGSRFGLKFLEYVSDKSHEWMVCIGVPYGTAIWQIGDSKEQNDSFNIAMTQEKII